MAADANGVPLNDSWVVGSGHTAADMYANVMAESTGQLLATRLYELTDDASMKDMLSFLIARDTMHQNQWLAVLEELGHGYARCTRFRKVFSRPMNTLNSATFL